MENNIIDVKAVAVNLRVARAKANMTQGDLAEKTGIAPSTLSFIENGKQGSIRASTLNKLADALNVSVESLLQA